MNLDQLLRDSAPHDDEMRRHTARIRPDVLDRASAPEAGRPSSGRGRWAVGLAAAAAAATAYVVVSPGGPAVSPAFAVTQEPDGDVVVAINRLEDAEGLEAALRANGIDADVTFDEVRIDLESVQGDAIPNPPAAYNPDPDCDNDVAPATLSRDGDRWLMVVPADSVLQDRHVNLAPTNAGELRFVYLSSDEPAGYCEFPTS